MKRLAILLGLAVVAFFAVQVLSDLTQSRPDPIREDEVTELVMEVDIDRFRPGRDAAAQALWAVCSAQTGSTVVDGTGPTAVGDGHYRVVLAPAVGHHDERKLVGCLEDLTVDRVLADVEVFRALPANG
jgi:hypothetical protein